MQEYNSQREFDLEKVVSVKHEMRRRGRKELQVKSFSNKDMQAFIKNEEAPSSHHDFDEEQQEHHSDRTPQADQSTHQKVANTQPPFSDAMQKSKTTRCTKKAKYLPTDFLE